MKSQALLVICIVLSAIVCQAQKLNNQRNLPVNEKVREPRLVRPLSRLAAPSTMDKDKEAADELRRQNNIAKKLALGSDQYWEILRDIREMDENGYYYTYETENEIVAGETGKIKNKGLNTEAMDVDGYYEYRGDDGKKYRTDYVANEYGYFPRGDHIHPSILNALDLIYRNARYGNFQQQ